MPGANGMTLEEAAKWVDKNCNDETVARLRSRAVAKVLLDEVRRQEELIHDLAGVLWRLEEYGYIGYEVDDDERGQCDHWREIGRQAVEIARRPPWKASNYFSTQAENDTQAQA